MRKIVLSFTLLLAALFTSPVFCQVGIGTMSPDKTAALDVTWENNPLGALIPRMSEAERDNIEDPANGLLIFNTDENCINAYDAVNIQWNSLCGGIAKSVFTASCDGVKSYGAYIKDTPLNNSNYLTLMVDVTKAGIYTVSVTTSNGYGFNTSGTFLNTGIQQVSLSGQGKPLEVSDPGDAITLTLNGVEQFCPSVVIPVLPAIATYTMSCGNAKVNGVYQLGVPLNNTNTMTLPVIVTDISTGGSWSITTNKINGVSFSGFGTFTSTGVQTVTLQGTGTPTSTTSANLTLSSNSGGEVETTCNVTVIMAIPSKTVLTLGNGIYNFANTNAGPNYMLKAVINYGTQDNSTVKYVQPFNFTNGDTFSDAALTNLLTGANPPDIVITGYPWDPTNNATIAQTFLNYLNNGGVVLMFCQQTGFTQAIVRTIFGDNSLTVSSNGGTAGSRYLIPLLNNDPIINGPFGNIGGKYWGEDASTTSTIPNIANNPNITVYSTSPNNGNVTAFRHNTLSLFWIGDGGLNAWGGLTNTSTTTYPFMMNANYVPVEKSNYGPGSFSTTNGSGPIINSILTANAVAWAIQMAQAKGK